MFVIFIASTCPDVYTKVINSPSYTFCTSFGPFKSPHKTG